MGNWMTQVFVVTLTNLRTLPQRIGPALAAVVGVAGVMLVLVAVLSVAEGFRRTLSSTGDPYTAIVMRGGTDTEMNSALELEATRIISDAPGVRRDPDGPWASAELLVIVDILTRSTGTAANVPMRGIGPRAFSVRPEVRLVEGRKFEPGKSEVIVGIGAAQQFVGLEVGNTLRFGESEWTVVGIFSADGTVSESEIWADARVVQPAFLRGSTFQSVYARLDSPEAFPAFKDALTADPRLDVKVERESDYFESQSVSITTMIRTLGFLLASLMGVGAVFGAINTMYSAVASRAREIATLRALGFGGGPVVISVLVESLLLAALGGLGGALAAYVLVDGFRAATLNWDTFSQVTFSLQVTPTLILQALASSLVLGLLGGLFPAIRAARQPVASALRQL